MRLAKDPKTAQKWAVLYIKSQNGVVDWITDLLLYNGVKSFLNKVLQLCPFGSDVQSYFKTRQFWLSSDFVVISQTNFLSLQERHR